MKGYCYDRHRKIHRVPAEDQQVGQHGCLVLLCCEAIHYALWRVHEEEPSPLQGVLDRTLQTKDGKHPASRHERLCNVHWQTDVEDATHTHPAEAVSGECHKRCGLRLLQAEVEQPSGTLLVFRHPLSRCNGGAYKRTPAAESRTRHSRVHRHLFQGR